jgi:ubiquinone/menaquinone biosynthesis C-methylase UbiE
MDRYPDHGKDGQDWRAFYRREADRYDASRYGSRYGRLFKQLHHDTLNELLHSSLPANVLDVAAGTGHVTELLASMGFTLTSVDLTEEMLAVARHRISQKGLKAGFVLGNAFTLPFANDTFQVVISTRFLHLWPEDQQRILISEMARVLRKGGILIVDFDNWWHRAILHVPIFFYQRVLGRGRVVEEYYSKVHAVKTIIQDAGIRIVNIRGIGGYPLVIPMMVSVLSAFVIGRFVGRTCLHRPFSEQFVIRGQKS